MADFVNVCGSCRQDFSSIRAFDSHRVGRHAYTVNEGFRLSPPLEDGRRCLAAHEMLEGGQFAQDGRGRWFLVGRREATRRAFSGRLDIAERAA